MWNWHSVAYSQNQTVSFSFKQAVIWILNVACDQFSKACRGNWTILWLNWNPNTLPDLIHAHFKCWNAFFSVVWSASTVGNSFVHLLCSEDRRRQIKQMNWSHFLFHRHKKSCGRKKTKVWISEFKTHLIRKKVKTNSSAWHQIRV